MAAPPDRLPHARGPLSMSFLCRAFSIVFALGLLLSVGPGLSGSTTVAAFHILASSVVRWSGACCRARAIFEAFQSRWWYFNESR